MRSSVRSAVRRRAGERCEYCRLSDVDDGNPFHVEHITARQHGGSDGLGNLAWCCQHCNLKKGPNRAGYLAESDEVVALFHPRRQNWSRHFRWSGAILVGRTKVGQVTIRTLELNSSRRVKLRRLLIAAGHRFDD